MYETILVATDGSDSANRAVDRAIDLAGAFDAELHGLSVIDTRRYGDSMLTESASVVASLEDRARELLTDLESRAEVPVTTELRRGRPNVEIGACAEEIDADLIVLGNRGLGGDSQIGSTAERVVRHVNRPTITA